MSTSEYISPLVGRLVLAWFFLSQSWILAHQWDAAVAGMTAKQLPVAPLLMALAIVVMVMGALSLIFGFHARHGAMLLFAFVILVSVLMHDFWKEPDAAQRAADYELFARNMAIGGGLLMIVGMGPGRFALDNRGDRNRH